MRSAKITLLLFSMVVLPGCFVVATEELKGIRPIYPENAVTYTLASRQPKFEWDGEPGKKYDLFVAEMIESKDTKNTSTHTHYGYRSTTTTTSGHAIRTGKVIFEKNGINGQCFQLPFELTEGKYYRWSVKESGSDQWSTWSGSAFAGAATPYSSMSMSGKLNNVGFGFYVPRESEIYTRGPSRLNRKPPKKK